MAANTRNSGGVMAYAVAVTLLGVLFVLSLLVAILFKTQVGDAQRRATEAEQKLADVINREEQGLDEVQEAINRSENLTLVGTLLQENRSLKQLINASPSQSLESIKNEMASQNLATGQTFMAEIGKLRSELVAARETAVHHEQQTETAQKQLATIQEEKSELARKYDQAVSQLKGEVTKIHSQHSQHTQQKDSQLDTLEKDLASVRTEKQEKIDQLEESVQQKDQQVAVFQKRIDELKRMLRTGGAGVDPSRESDGTIIAVLSEENLVYIDRGQADHVLLGMTFEVFDESVGVQADEFGDLRGTATIEVISMTENASMARVVRTSRKKNIQEGDLIANIVYNPNTTYSFHVFGKFDIDNTGQATATDRRRIEVMVSKWKGVLAKRLSYSTDFLVLGEEPTLPPPLPPGVIQPEIIEQWTEKMRLYEKYHDLVQEAKSLSVPILNQNRFLTLVGYYQR